jgi:hypothetical protein
MDLSQEHKGWDNVEPLTWEISRGGPVEVRSQLAQQDSIPVAKRRATTYREQVSSGGVYLSSDVVWHIPAAVLTPGNQPKMGDVLIDQDGGRWTILDIQLARWKQRWQCTTRNLSVVYGLNDYIDIQARGITHDAAGATILLWPPDGGSVSYPKLPCRVQLRQESQATGRGLRGKQLAYDIIVDRQIVISTEDRILWNGKILDVTGYRAAESITELPIVEAVLRP